MIYIIHKRDTSASDSDVYKKTEACVYLNDESTNHTGWAAVAAVTLMTLCIRRW